MTDIDPELAETLAQPLEGRSQILVTAMGACVLIGSSLAVPFPEERVALPGQPTQEARTTKEAAMPSQV
jgi:hypothetical protein